MVYLLVVKESAMDRISLHATFLAAMGLALVLVGCKEKGVDTGCGNGLLGVGEECDCGSDPENLPKGCTAVNGGDGANCTKECLAVLLERCDNNVDDDGDGMVDCADDECDQHPRCLPESVCNDRVDNDGDGRIDCDDPDCQSLEVCQPEDCANGQDDNNDGFVDCQDAQCVGDPACEGVEVCWGGVDDDGDGYTDCDDEDCLGQSVCEAEDCANGVDDDGDFKVDCADRSCIESSSCVDTACGPALIDSSVTLSLVPGSQVATVQMDISTETDDSYGQCDVTNGKEHVLEIRLEEAGRLRVVYRQTGAHRYGLYFKGGAEAGCAAAMHSCVVPAINTDGVLEYGALPASQYYLIVSEDMAGTGGAVDLVLSLVDPDPTNVVELCDNLLDDDLDGQLDCWDLQCYEAAGLCDMSGCSYPPVPYYDLGALGPTTTPMHPMPGDDPALVELDTRGGSVDYSVTDCQGGTGPERLLRFTLDEPAMVQVGFKQDMVDAGDHVLALFFAGEGCSLAEHECIDPGGLLDGVVTFPGDPSDGGRYPPGEYFLVVKAIGGKAGRMDLQVITMDTPQEVCMDEGFDNDLDGDVNCFDSDCLANHVCVAEDCSDQVSDLDGDGSPGCSDTDPDDACACSYACACFGQSCDPADRVCDGVYDDDVLDLGVVVSGGSYPFDVDTSLPTVRADYDMETCHGSVGSTLPDVVVYFTLVTQADISFEFTQDVTVDHSGLLMYADRCRACDDPGPGNAYQIFCYYTESPWMQNNLPPGSYALLLKALPDGGGGVMSGHFTGQLVVDP